MKLLGDRSVASLMEGFLTYLWIVFWIGVALVVVGPLFLGDGSSFTFPADVSNAAPQRIQGPQGTWTIHPTKAQVSTPPGRGWMGGLIAAPLLALIAYVLGELRAIFRSLREGSPFVASNARRLRCVGLAVLLFEALRSLVMIAVVGPALESLRTHAGDVTVRASAWPSWEVVFLGFAILVFAEVFRRGTQMQDEQALTV